MFSSQNSQVSSAANYIEDVFSTYLYTGNGSTQTITNNIDLSTKGGLVWLKTRGAATINGRHWLTDTARGVNTYLETNSGSAANTGGVQAFNTDGFNLGGGSGNNWSGDTYVSWTFRKQPKFFDVVTTSSATVSHSLGSVAGFVIWKRTNAAEDWNVLARADDGSYYQLNLNLPDGAFFSYANASAAGITSTNITLPSFTTGGTYVVYLFAHNAGGFGLTGTDNVITCGSFTSNASGVASVTLGYEPQFLLCKTTSSNDSWQVWDNMRGLSQTSAAQLYPNLTQAETARTSSTPDLRPIPNATGFTHYWSPQANQTWIYIAIRRGPMKVPTDATKVFAPTLATANAPWFKPNFVVDMGMLASRSTTDKTFLGDRLRGAFYLRPNTQGADTTFPPFKFDYMNGWDSNTNANSDYIGWDFARAPSFMDVVCYTGNGTSARQVTHNLGVSPNLLIVKKRSAAGTDWCVYCSSLSNYDVLYLDLNSQVSSSSPPYNVFGTNTQQTSTYFTLGGSTNIDFYNASGATYIAYLFATCAGVSKVGSYTGTGATQTISCGFTSGARFVLIKRTDDIGDWYVWDTTRGMVSGTDPSLLLNSTAAEVNANSVYTTTGGFQIVSTAAGINASGGNYIFLAIA